ncbi:MAG TPA: signal peptidase II [Bryobacteraceae bacterium]|nr:signal peptidase II [Bryobacteraceae bacterium]
MSPRWYAYGVAAALFAFDRVTKWLVEANLHREDVITVIPGFFNLVSTRNRGVAFSLLANNDSEWRSFFLIGLTALVVAFVGSILWQTSPRGMANSRLTRLGLSLVLGGALGNFYDRVTQGAVIDFLDFYIGSYHWPSFNVADSGLTVGVSLVLLDLWRSQRREARS